MNNFLRSSKLQQFERFANSTLGKIAKWIASREVPTISANIDEFQRTLSLIRRVIPDPTEYNDVLDEYHRFIGRLRLQADGYRCEVATNNCRINVGVMPFNTVNVEPTLLNLGVSPQKEVDHLAKGLQRMAHCDIKIVLMHHNPFSSPELVENAITFGFNGMPSGSALIQLLQEHNVDLVLYGHQHKHSYMNIHYPQTQSGRVSLVGCPSSLTGDKAQANIIDIRDMHEAFVDEVFAVKGELGSTRFCLSEKKQLSLVLEPKSSPDIITSSARREIRKYRWAKNNSDRDYLKTYERLWNDCLKHTDIREIALLGPRHGELGEEESLTRLKAIIEDDGANQINIIIHDPSIHRKIKSLNENDVKVLNHITGDYYDWEDTAQTAARTIKGLEKIKSSLGDKGERINIIKTPILLPTGVRHVIRSNGEEYIIVRLIPVGVKDQKTAIVKLTRRKNNGMYQFYIDYMNAIAAKYQL